MFTRLSHDPPCRACRFLFSVVLLTVWTGADTRLRGAMAQQPAPPAPGGGATFDRARVAASAARTASLLQSAASRIPAETFDAQAVVTAVGRDPVQLFEWVRDHTYIVPYRGVLRGWQGVLMDRLGNSLDRALLLQRLLADAGHDARLARTELSQEDARKRLDAARPVPGDPLGTGGPGSPPDPTGASRVFAGLVEVHQVVEQAALVQQRNAEELAERVAEQRQVLADLLTGNLAGAPGAGRVPGPDPVSAVRDHWWVQLKREGDWLDLDPSLPDAAPGNAPGPVAQTVPLARLDDDLAERAHEVVIRVIIERWKEGRLQEEVVLAQTLRPCAFLGETITLQHSPLEPNLDLDAVFRPGAGGGVEGVKAALLKDRDWMPILCVGAQRAAQKAFTDEGFVFTPQKVPASIKAAIKMVRGVEAGAESAGTDVKNILRGGRIGGARVGRVGDARTPQVPPPSNDAVLTAEWIEYEVRVPGETAPPVRRQVFDLIGPARRAAQRQAAPRPEVGEADRLKRALSLAGATEICLPVCAPSPAFIESLVLKALAARASGMAKLNSRRDARAGELLRDLMALEPMPSPAQLLAAARQHTGVLAAEAYHDRPNIITRHLYVAEGPDGSLLPRQSFDIVENRLAVHSRAASRAFHVRLEQGLVDTNLEDLLASDAGASGEELAAPGASAPDVFAAAEAQGVAWVSVSPNDRAALARTRLDADTKARVEAELAAGFTAVVPDRPVVVEGRPVVRWWRVDSATGTTLGMGHNGWGSTSVEQAEVTKLITSLIALVVALVALLMCLRKAEKAATTGDMVYKQQKCVVSAGCTAVAAIWTGAIVLGPYALAAIAAFCKLGLEAFP